jgi:hypothetical protein
VRILVVVAGTQARALRAEAGKGSVRTAFGHGLVGPKQRDNSVERCTILCKPFFFFFFFLSFFSCFFAREEREREREREKVCHPSYVHAYGGVVPCSEREASQDSRTRNRDACRALKTL